MMMGGWMTARMIWAMATAIKMSRAHGADAELQLERDLFFHVPPV